MMMDSYCHAKCGVNSMMTDPYCHPKHMKVVNHTEDIFEWMWKLLWEELEPQPMHTGLGFICIWCHAVLHDFSLLFKCGGVDRTTE